MIIGIDKRGNDLGAIDFVETQWNRKWSSCGDFVVYMPASKYDPRIKYIQNSGRPETGIVQKVEYDEKSNGKFITLSGYFIDKIADGGAMYKTWKLGSELMAPRDAIETYLKTTLSGFVDGVGFVSGCCSEPTYKHEIAEASVLPAALAKTIVAETPTGQALFEALGGDGYSYHCEPIFAPEDVSENEYPIIGLSFVFKAGRNLADKVFFGENYNNVSGIKIIEDESNIKNSIVLTYKVDSLDGWDGFESFETTEDGVTSYYLYQKYDTSAINPVSGVGRSSNGMVQELDDKYAKKIKDLPANLQPASLRMMMDAQATLISKEHKKIESIELSILQERYYYLEDYDLGDVCSVYVNDLEKMYTARIEEVREVHAENKVDIEIVIGTPTRQKWRAI